MLSTAMIASGSAGYVQMTPLQGRVAPMQRAEVSMSAETNSWKAAGLAAALALATGVQSASAGPFTRSEIQSLTYEQIKGTGLANTCPQVTSTPRDGLLWGSELGDATLAALPPFGCCMLTLCSPCV